MISSQIKKQSNTPQMPTKGNRFLDKLYFKQFLVLTVTGDVCSHYFIMTSDLMLRRIKEKGNWF